jgi:hypothetical protein
LNLGFYNEGFEFKNLKELWCIKAENISHFVTQEMQNFAAEVSILLSFFPPAVPYLVM